MSTELVDRPANRAELDALRAAGYTVETDEAFVLALARRYGMSEDLARRALAGELDDVVVVD